MLALAGCDGSAGRDVRPTPPAGLEPVTVGELVQLRLAVEGFDTVFDARAEEQDFLPYLAHALATFYHRPDPAPSFEARYRFIEALCRARLPQKGPQRELLSCMERLREALYDDLLGVTRAYRRKGRPDRVGEHRLSEIEKDFGQRRRVFLATRKLREDRRASLALPEVSRCELEQPAVPVVALAKASVMINGYPVITAPGGLKGLPLAEYESFASALESRLLEVPRGAGQTAQLIVATHGQVSLEALGRVLGRAARLGVTRICLKVNRAGSFLVPCCLPIRLGPFGVEPTRYLELGPGTVTLVDGGSRVSQPVTGPFVSPGAASLGAVSIRLGRRGSGVDLARLVERAWAGTGAVPELLPTAAPARRVDP